MSKLNNVIPYTGVHHADHLPELCGPALELPGAGHVQAEQQQAGEHHGHPHGVITITVITVWPLWLWLVWLWPTDTEIGVNWQKRLLPPHPSTHAAV